MSFWNPAPSRNAGGIQNDQFSTIQQGVPLPKVMGQRVVPVTWVSNVYNQAVAPAATGKKGAEGKKGGATANGQNLNYFGQIVGVLATDQCAGICAIEFDGSELWPGGTSWAAGDAISAGQIWVYNGMSYVALQSMTAALSNAPGANTPDTYWQPYVYAWDGSSNYTDFDIYDTSLAAQGKGKNQSTYRGKLRFYWGTATQTADSLLQSGGNDYGEQHPDMPGVVRVELLPGSGMIGFLFGCDKPTAPNVRITIRSSPVQSVLTGSTYTSVTAADTNGDTNIAVDAIDILTSTNALGLANAGVDATTFGATALTLGNDFADHCQASVLMDTQDTVSSWFDKFTTMIDGWIRYDAASGLIKCGLYEHGTTPGSYTQLAFDDLTERPKFKSTSWKDVASRVTPRWPEKLYAYQTVSARVDDPRAFNVIGVREKSYDLPFVTSTDIALANAKEFLRQACCPQLEAEIVVRREKGRNILPGQYVLLDVELETTGTQLLQYFRVKQREVPFLGPIKFTLLADNTLTPIPYSGTSTAIIPQQNTVNAIAQARVVEVTEEISGEDGAVVVLAERPDNYTTGFHVYFDTSSGGTFSTMLGAQTNFASYGTLQANVAATDTTISVDVSAQPDGDFWTTAFTSIEAADDEWLMFLVATVTSGGDTGEIAEDANGYALVEVCSVSGATAISGGYSVTVLRARQGTPANAFSTANTEVWLVPRRNLVPMYNLNFPVIRQNRIAGTTPAYAQFKLTPFTFRAELPLSSASAIQFRFAESKPSAPNLTLSSPSIRGVTLTSPTYPAQVTVSGTWSAPNSNLVDWQVLLEKSTDTAPRKLAEEVFTSQPSAAFNVTAQIEDAGSYTLTLLAFCANGLSTQWQIPITATGAGAVVATPAVEYNGLALTVTPSAHVSDTTASTIDTYANIGSFGPLTTVCPTPGAAANFRYRFGVVTSGFGSSASIAWGSWSSFTGGSPLHALSMGIESVNLSSYVVSASLTSTTVTGTATGTPNGSVSVGSAPSFSGNNQTFTLTDTDGDSTFSPTSYTPSGSISGGTYNFNGSSSSFTLSANVSSGAVTVNMGTLDLYLPSSYVQFECYSTLAGFTDSAHVVITFNDFNNT